MFQENQDITACLSPVDLPENTFSEAETEDRIATLDVLFERLQTFLSKRGNEPSALCHYITESGIEDLITKGFDAFKAQVETAVAQPPESLEGIYALALTCFEEDKIEDAALLFALISTIGAGQAPVLSAMAACACRQTHYQHGYDLATESVAYKERHPRTHLLAGYCALKLKDHKNAKRFLALTSRIARKNPLYANEQRCAQRELLMMQFAS